MTPTTRGPPASPDSRQLCRRRSRDPAPQRATTAFGGKGRDTALIAHPTPAGRARRAGHPNPRQNGPVKTDGARLLPAPISTGQFRGGGSRTADQRGAPTRRWTRHGADRGRSVIPVAALNRNGAIRAIAAMIAITRPSRLAMSASTPTRHPGGIGFAIRTHRTHLPRPTGPPRRSGPPRPLGGEGAAPRRAPIIRFRGYVTGTPVRPTRATETATATVPGGSGSRLRAANLPGQRENQSFIRRGHRLYCAVTEFGQPLKNSPDQDLRYRCT